MAEELVMNVKSNIKSVTKDTQDWNKALKETNESIVIQEKVINELDKDLIKLKAQQDAIPKGAWVKGMDGLNDKIKKTTTELKLEKNALKGLKQEQKQATKEVDKFNKEQAETNKQLQEGVGNFRLMGVSLNDIRSSFGKIIPLAKTMFGTIKAGLISTGIGAFVLALGSIVSYFTNTKAGADKLKVGLAGLGAVVDVLKDRLSAVGEAIGLALSGKWTEAAKKLKDSVTGIVAEAKEEVKIMTALEKRLQTLRDAELAFAEQKAKTRQEIEKARLIAEDETKSAAERLENLKKALELEEKTTQRELELAREKVAIQEEQMKTSQNLVADEQKLSDLRVQLTEKETASVKLRRRVVTEVNTLEREIAAEQAAIAKDRQDAIDAEIAAKQKLVEIEEKRLEEQVKRAGALLDEFNTKQLTAIEQEKKALREKYQVVIDGEKEISETRIQLEENLQAELDAIDAKYDKQNLDKIKQRSISELKWSEMTAKQKVSVAQQAVDGLAQIAGEETAAGKALAVTSATINTYSAATAALAPPPVGAGPILGPIFAGVAIATGLSNIQKILSSGGGGGGASAGAGNISAPSTTSEAPPAPQMMSGEFNLAGGVEPEPIKAFVVTDELSSSQAQLANIRRRATI